MTKMAPQYTKPFKRERKKFFAKVRAMSDEELEALFVDAMEHGASNWDSYLAPNNCLNIWQGFGQ